MAESSDKSSGQATELQELKQKLSDYEALLKRIQADFENYKKRTAKALSEEREAGKAELFYELIPFIESIDGALKQGSLDADGLKLMHKQLWQIIEGNGFRMIQAKGKKFDSGFHEAM
ncbi:nucleotide exchange factor GrpE, partial [archaeon]|nr:nucleotide exchange factor GrpE [archaeon]